MRFLVGAADDKEVLAFGREGGREGVKEGREGRVANQLSFKSRAFLFHCDNNTGSRYHDGPPSLPHTPSLTELDLEGHDHVFQKHPQESTAIVKEEAAWLHVYYRPLF